MLPKRSRGSSRNDSPSFGESPANVMDPLTEPSITGPESPRIGFFLKDDIVLVSKGLLSTNPGKCHFYGVFDFQGSRICARPTQKKALQEFGTSVVLN